MTDVAKPPTSTSTSTTIDAVTPEPPTEFRFDVPVEGRVSWSRHLTLSVQNMVCMAGLFLFPGLFGAAYHLQPSKEAVLYGAAFIVVGFGTVLQGTLGLRLPIVLGPWSATFAGLLVVGKIYGLGTAFGSLTIAAIIVSVLSIPVRGASLTQVVARFFAAPILSGGIVFITGLGLTQIAVVNWLGTPGKAGFGAANWIGGLAAILVVAALFGFTRGMARSLSMIAGIVVGALVYLIFAPVHFTAVTTGHWIVVPSAFTFGFNVNTTSVILFVVLLLPPLISAFGFYPVVGAWDGQDVSSNRMAWGAFGVALTGILAGALGTFSGAVYPENVGLLRSSKVGSRWVTITCGGLFILAGFVYKIGAIFVGIPSSVIGAAAVVMFAVIMMSGIEILAKVTWTPRAILVLGLPTVLAIGGVFVSPAVYAKYPLIARELITQPLVTGPFLLVIFYLLDKVLPDRAAKKEAKRISVDAIAER